MFGFVHHSHTLSHFVVAECKVPLVATGEPKVVVLPYWPEQTESKIVLTQKGITLVFGWKRSDNKFSSFSRNLQKVKLKE